MTAILKSFHKLESQFDKRAERFALHHPYLTFIAMFVSAPFFILSAVACCTALVALLLSVIFGW